MEINFNHGDALELADQVFLFKRTVREAAIKHNMHATFLAKPMAKEAGSALHIHQSVIDKAGNNIFSMPNGEASEAFGVLCHQSGQDLDRPLPVQPRVPGTIDFSHAPRTDPGSGPTTDPPTPISRPTPHPGAGR